ncbi:hypothetical protein V1477_006875 [Vespula maculifrons]|uniref:Uncharacterized protein n=1 Tax=Vespula maculifrons TaxID=7453 RepID=A0ABD2CJG8_VESMC
MKFFRKRHRQLCLVALGRDDVIDLVTDGSLHDLLLDSDIALFSSCNLVPSELTVPQGDIFEAEDPIKRLLTYAFVKSLRNNVTIITTRSTTFNSLCSPAYLFISLTFVR